MAAREDYPGNCMSGQLTRRGYQQQLANGDMYRSVYFNASNPTIPRAFLRNSTQDVLWLRADDYPRTIQSAEALTLTLFPPNASAPFTDIITMHTMDLCVLCCTAGVAWWHRDSPKLGARIGTSIRSSSTPICALRGRCWRTRPSTRQSSSQYVAVDSMTCHMPHSLALSLTDSMGPQHIVNVTVPILDEIYKQANITVRPEDLEGFMDCLNCHMCHGFEIPVTSELAQTIQVEVEWQKKFIYNYPDRFTNSRLGIGFLIRDMFSWFQSRVLGRGPGANKQFVLYGGYVTVTRSVGRSAVTRCDNKY